MKPRIPDLWPADIGDTDPALVTPAVILREQANLLKQKTKGLVAGGVTRDRFGQPGRVWLSFYLVAPVLEDYRCHLFRVEHGIEQIYPVRLALSVNLPEEEPVKYSTLATEADFVEKLGAIFASQKTRSLVQSLIAQSKAVSEK